MFSKCYHAQLNDILVVRCQNTHAIVVLIHPADN